MGYRIATEEVKAAEQHTLCFDTKKEYAWVAYKDGQIRCFLEHKEYPHRARGSFIE